MMAFTVGYTTYLYIDYAMRLMYRSCLAFNAGFNPSHGLRRAATRGELLRSCSNEAAMTAKTPKARTNLKARLHLFPVSVLFRPVISGAPGRPDRTGVRPFPVFLP